MQKLKVRPKPLLFLVLALLITGGLFLSQKEKTYDWIFIYYMSYDNDLSGFGQGILRDLQKGIVNSKVVVLTQTDFIDNKGLKRIALYQSFTKKRKEISLKSEDSADPNQLKKYFLWIQQNWKANNYCIVFLNHGGKLNSMCLDEKPFFNQNKNKELPSEKWLPATEVGKILADFNRMVGYKVRLLFLQQCGRATIQNLYSFTDAAKYILASPVIVGAPNTYYTKTIKSATNDSNTTGTTLARTIMREDKDYTFYTLIDNNELKRIPEKLQPVLNCFTNNPHLNPPPSCLPIFEFKEEKFYDLKSYFQALSTANNNIGRQELQLFFDWCDNHLVISRAYKNTKNSAVSSYSGLSIYIPSDQNDVGRYNDLPLYKQTNLNKVLDRLAHQ